MDERRKQLRRLIEGDDLVTVVGAYDALSAVLAERAGFKALHVGGYCLSAAHYAMPDVGLLTMSEMLGFVRTIAARTGLPIIADGDDGYGNYVNVTRLIQELERAGAAAVHIEDQVFPKRCGHMAGKRVVSIADMVTKVRAAVAARSDPDFIIIARTDAIAVTGFDDALERAKAYAAAGADVVFVEAPENETQAAAVPKAISVPTVFNWCYGGRSPMPPATRVKEMGYRLILFPDVLFPVAKALADFYDEIMTTGTYAGVADRLVPFEEFNRLVGIDKVEALDRSYG